MIRLTLVLDKLWQFMKSNPDIEVSEIRGNYALDDRNYGFSTKKEEYLYNFRNMSYLNITLENPVVIETVSGGTGDRRMAKTLDFHQDYLIVYPGDSDQENFFKIRFEGVDSITFRKASTDEIRFSLSSDLLRKMRDGK